MAASAEQNEIIELTDLIEKGPDLPKNSPKSGTSRMYIAVIKPALPTVV